MNHSMCRLKEHCITYPKFSEKDNERACRCCKHYSINHNRQIIETMKGISKE